MAVSLVCGFGRLHYRSFLPFPIEQDLGLPVQPERSLQADWPVCFVHHRMLAIYARSRKALSFNDHYKHFGREAYRSAPCNSRRFCGVAFFCFRPTKEVYRFILDSAIRPLS